MKKLAVLGKKQRPLRHTEEYTIYVFPEILVERLEQITEKRFPAYFT